MHFYKHGVLSARVQKRCLKAWETLAVYMKMCRRLISASVFRCIDALYVRYNMSRRFIQRMRNARG